MPNIFGADIAGAILDGLGGLVFDQTLTKTTSIKDPDNSTRQIKSTVPYPCKGFLDDYSKENNRNGATRVTDVKAVILGASLPAGVVPAPGDTITAEGRILTIVEEGVVRDPAGATYECQAR